MDDKAIAGLEALLAKGQDNALLRLSLGNAYLQKQQVEIALIHYAQATQLDPSYSAAWKGYGKALAENQQIEEAIQAYTTGITVAEQKGDKQTMKEMQVFLKRLQKL
ncbi:tetratricopeptide repeat protein [Beggiatoa leptomitoformis]|uniref:Tetratricopeptide repeat protein n=2 Tax=Beggiatoa leptomitoformis TaxID=288004 RepID=A0A2N9YIT3_9GAMM|nr:tetratricopeptide repeat protein [Beggiatoa leptomitoformis]AUI70451.1 tetratricopeptide repeat protein [Beggiatoa leptomitoformis]